MRYFVWRKNYIYTAYVLCALLAFFVSDASVCVVSAVSANVTIGTEHRADAITHGGGPVRTVGISEKVAMKHMQAAIAQDVERAGSEITRTTKQGVASIVSKIKDNTKEDVAPRNGINGSSNHVAKINSDDAKDNSQVNAISRENHVGAVMNELTARTASTAVIVNHSGVEIAPKIASTGRRSTKLQLDLIPEVPDVDVVPGVGHTAQAADSNSTSGRAVGANSIGVAAPRGSGVGTQVVEKVVPQPVPQPVPQLVPQPVKPVVRSDDANGPPPRARDSVKSHVRSNTTIVHEKHVPSKRSKPGKVHRKITMKHSENVVHGTHAGFVEPHGKDQVRQRPAVNLTSVEIIKRPVYDYRNVILSPNISKKYYGEENMHLPKSFYQSEYSNLLFAAVADDNIQYIKALLSKDADINARIAETGDTPLMYALKKNKMNAFRYLILRGADVNRLMSDGKTILHVAVADHLYDYAVVLLTESNIDPSIVDDDESTAFEHVNDTAILNDSSIIVPLVKKYRSLDQALADVASMGSLLGVEYAITRGADVNVGSAQYPFDTPLISASKRCDRDMVNALLVNGADPTLRNAYDESPISIAQSCGDDGVYDLVRTVLLRQDIQNTIKSTEEIGVVGRKTQRPHGIAHKVVHRGEYHS